MTVVICDLDQTVFDNSHREHLIQGPNPNWDAFGSPELILKDKPIAAAITALAYVLKHPTFPLYFLTGRSEVARAATIQCLHSCLPEAKDAPVLMRPDNDFRKAVVFKETEIQKVQARHQKQGMIFIDDDLRNAEMYRKYGVFLHAPGCWDFFK